MKKRILVVDDEEMVRNLMRRILTKSGYEVHLASDGNDALVKLEDLTVDLIMLDMNMPRMNGIDFLKKVNEDNHFKIPVLMVSGSADIDMRIESYKLGAYDFIKKPEETEIMLKRIENGLKIGEMINFNEFIKIELLMAKKLQKYLYPESKYRGDIDITIWSRQLSDIGGDLYDYHKFYNGDIIFFVADVSGHSISAAMFAAIVKMVFRNAIKVTSDPSVILEKMNNELAESLPVESFVTMFCGMVNFKESKLEYANAGHPKPYFISDNSYSPLEGNGPFLGPIQDANFEKFGIDIKKGDSLLLYTDGVLDIIDHTEMPAGKELLLKALDSEGKNSLEKFEFLTSEILQSEYTITDDCTTMLIEY